MAKSVITHLAYFWYSHADTCHIPFHPHFHCISHSNPSLTSFHLIPSSKHPSELLSVPYPNLTPPRLLDRFLVNLRECVCVWKNSEAKYCQRRWLWSAGMLPSSPLNCAWQALTLDTERKRERGERKSMSRANWHHAARFFHYHAPDKDTHCYSVSLNLSYTHSHKISRD